MANLFALPKGDPTITGFGAIDITKPYEFIGFGAIPGIGDPDPGLSGITGYLKAVWPEFFGATKWP